MALVPDALNGGVLATFKVSGERFKVWVTNPSTIQQIFDLQEGKSKASIPNGVFHRGPGLEAHNSPRDWHLDPEEIELAENTIEVCDGLPSYIDDHIDDFIKVGRYCPWLARLVDVKDYR